MLTNRTSTVVIVIALAALAVATASFAAPKAPQASDDFALRHASGIVQPAAALAAYYFGSDYTVRHTTNSIDTSDYALRHPEWMLTAQAIDTSDYFLRHAAQLTSAAVDTTDYFLRHLELIGR